METQIERNIRAVRKRIVEASTACGRSPQEITLLAISKKFPAEVISRAAAAGLSMFGENRVQEAEEKILHFRERCKFEWHLVGHLQTNKARRAAELFDCIHSLDSLRLAAKLNQACLEIGKKLSVLLQVDLGREETKFGAGPEHVRDIIEGLSLHEGLRLDGLMTVPPFFEDPEQVRPYFVSLRELRDTLELEHRGCLGQQHLSMGMSHDFEVAIREGATIIRIGTSIFGARPYE
jgi:pyridoxal phosphate enzyme (YggS family)